VDRIPLIEFPTFPIVLPPLFLQQQADAILSSLGEQLDNLLSRQANLRRMRDLLLPKLISGEVDVDGLDIETGEGDVA
jgi:type I restriction enzyme, S subunit